MTQSATDPTENPDPDPLPSPKERRRLREAKSLSEEQLARAVGVTRATLRSWETGRTSPRGRKRETYAKLLAEYEAEIAAGEGEEPPQEDDGATTVPADPPHHQGPEPDTPHHQGPEPDTPARDPDTRDPDNGAAATSTRPKPARPVLAPTLTPEDAFDALYEHTAPGLVRQTYLLTGRRRLSLEAVEWAFHRAWQRWPEVAVDPDPAGWVRAAAYEYATAPWQRLRRSHRRPDPAPPADAENLASAPADPRWRVLRETLLDLPPAYRRTLLLYDGLGIDLPETAAETEASTPAAANRVLHARSLVAERLPELTRPDTLHERLSDLVAAVPAPEVAPAHAVRTGSELRTRFWTRAAVGLTAMIIGAAIVTAVTAQNHYEPKQAPGESVGGVPPRPGPQPLTAQAVQLRALLQNHPLSGPERLAPLAR
ncbi:helix-turn-helix domain-containing protein [Streptomyces sp. NPDC000410]|uniref:helix-turn-helix domain-containing protein n=1 Tax=Streptomyces sp. NPDC000410 TaxID=3154254 RepID=UPI003321882B